MMEEIFGLPVTVHGKWDKEDRLPLFIRECYSFARASIGNVPCLLLTPVEPEPTLKEMMDHVSGIEKVEPVPVVFHFISINEYRRDVFIRNRIAFITERQAYIPFLGAILMNEGIRKERRKKCFTYSAQLLVLLYLARREKRLYVSEAAKFLSYSAMTLSRAVAELKDTGLFSVTKAGVNNVIEGVYEGRELFDNVRPYLSSPVRRTGYISRKDVNEDMVLTSENALGAKTMLCPPEISTYAVAKRKFDGTRIVDEFFDEKNQVKIELWAYDPTILSSDGYPDNLSLILSLQDVCDERVEEAAEELLRIEFGGKNG